MTRTFYCRTFYGMSALLASAPVSAAEELARGVNMAWIALAAALVFFMQAGFALLECGMCRTKNSLNVVMKNYMDMCIGSLVFWALGYGLMFGTNASGWFGTDNFMLNSAEPGDYGLLLFQMMFATTAVTIASGAMAERTRFIAYLLGAFVVCALIYPVFGAWAWNGGGWLAQLGFVDFAGSSVVHSTGAWIALAGIVVLGPRLGRFDGAGKPREIRGHNLTLVALGGFILWFGWFGFNAGSTLAVGEDIGLIVLNTQLAATAGATGVMCYRLLRGRPLLLTEIVNGSLAGLVGITAGCASMTPVFAVFTGLVAGLVYSLGSAWLLHLRVDDVVGAVSVHGFAGAWGTLAAGLFYAEDPFNMQRLLVQWLGVMSCFIWVFSTAMLMYWLIDRTLGLRASAQQEQRGLDLSEHAEVGYPEFHAATAYTAERASQLEARS